MKSVGLIAMLLISCAVGAAQAAGKPALAAHWKAVELNEKTVSGLTLNYAADTKTVSGTSGCNRFTGGIAVDNDKLKIGPLAGTRMMRDGKMQLEAEYLAALQAAESFAVQDDILMLKGEGGEILAKFTK